MEAISYALNDYLEPVATKEGAEKYQEYEEERWYILAESTKRFLAREWLEIYVLSFFLTQTGTLPWLFL